MLMDKFHVVISHNTFQHLSPSQRDNYVESVSKVIHPKGCFIVNSLLTTEDKLEKSTITTEGGVPVIAHYGQFIEIETKGSFMERLKKYGFRIYQEVEAYNGFITFYCCRTATDTGEQ